MSEEKMISQIKDLIEDRKSFITDDEETSKVFKEDVAALEMILDKYQKLSQLVMICNSAVDKKENNKAEVYDGKEIFGMLYDNQIDITDCIEIIHPEMENAYIFRDKFTGQFDSDKLLIELLFKEYQFRIVNQEKVKNKLFEKETKREIERLEKRLKELKDKNKEEE